jgi:hypothetical protein
MSPSDLERVIIQVFGLMPENIRLYPGHCAQDQHEHHDKAQAEPQLRSYFYIIQLHCFVHPLIQDCRPGLFPVDFGLVAAGSGK